MAQISDVMHASAVFDAARQELAWSYSGDFTDVPEAMKGTVHTISEVLNEAEMRWMKSTRPEAEPMAAVVDKENGMAVVATGHEEKKTEDVDTRSIPEAERKTKDWLLRVEEVACDMRAVARKDLLGDYSRIDDDKLSARWLSCLPRTSRAARTTPTIDTVALKLEELMKRYHEEFGHSAGLPLAAGGQEETDSSVTGDELVERYDDEVNERIVEILEGDPHNRNRTTAYTSSSAIFFPIVGPPCAGKTTLAKWLFQKASSSGDYYKVWVDMVKGWDIKEIHESIIEILGRDHLAGLFDDRENYIIGKVKSEADYGRYIDEMLRYQDMDLFLVLDNLQEELGRNDEEHASMLKQLRKLLKNHGSRVVAILTTRSEALATYISRFNKYQPHRLDSSSHYYTCQEIIKRTTGIDLIATSVDIDVYEIASKCSGIPLAAKALGRFLQSVDPQQWTGLIEDDVWNIGGGFSSDSQQLRRLPIHSATMFTHLKHSSGIVLGAQAWLSLAYCAFVLLPKGLDEDDDDGVLTQDLLNQWCSLGITTRKHGASCIRMLLDHSLIILAKKPASPGKGVTEDEILAATLLRMEDLMHDFARYYLGDRLIIVDGTNGTAAPTPSPVNNNKSSSAYLALIRNFDGEQQLDIASILPAGILALRFKDCSEMEASEAEFAKYACLRLLDLSGCSVKKLPHCIGHLKRLRYLKARGIEDQVFPRSITGLRELRYLILHGSCQLEDLTDAFHRLSNLLHLDLSGCVGLKALPDSFGRLWRLERLDLSACSGIEALPESFCWLRNLTHLDLVDCSGLKELPQSFVTMTHGRLRWIDLSGCSLLRSPTGTPHPDTRWGFRGSVEDPASSSDETESDTDESQ